MAATNRGALQCMCKAEPVERRWLVLQISKEARGSVKVT